MSKVQSSGMMIQPESRNRNQTLVAVVVLGTAYLFQYLPEFFSF